MPRLLLLLCFCWFCGATQAADLSAKMLAKGSALIEVNGAQRMLRAGQTSPEGVTLISASRSGARVEYQGQTYDLTLQKHIATSFEQAEKAEVRIASGRGGHYEVAGRINGVAVDFMVDTGATSIAMNSQQAQRLGINYLAGDQTRVSTANGIATAYRVWLDKVSVGSVEVKHVEAVVIVGRSPHVILLGNSYLSLVDMSTDNGVLVLQARH
ncbi:retropepsin-like aspartic protease family protein [Gilvimarinus xylanilyticus]|uniref:TIGR02281 family clan AA aspartic protease n=1 Tax=Gilvimarinus xylanilyticus TaxID=2944139 RepID=A0A9X2HYQ8_9GAMM|nr:TIGR02281 family clan AA aspartic protease [Gilvimarinus xylanilyticus]MCP8900169.1 TIGR02281 family clan AA aspartic protease [Gilvimarinus xylanilyticus]